MNISGTKIFLVVIKVLFVPLIVLAGLYISYMCGTKNEYKWD